MNAINHVADLEQAIERLINVTQPGGRVIISIDVHKYTFIKKIFRWVPLDILHPHQHSTLEYAKLITREGCLIEKDLLLKPGYIFEYRVLIARKTSQ